MEILVNILIWLHFMALAAGGAAVFGMPVVGGRMASASAETRPTLLAIMKGISTVSRAGLATLIVTGPLILFLRGGLAGANVWFWIKMALVLALLAGVIYSGINMKRSVAGDAEAGKRAGLLGRINGLLLLAIVFAAVFAFE